MSIEPPLWLCIHETGHAVAHFVINEHLAEFETIVTSVHVCEKEGVVEVKTRKNASPLNCAVRCLAGYVAEMRCRKGEDWLESEKDNIVRDMAAGEYDRLTDIEMARDYLARAGLNTEDDLRRAWLETVSVVASHWESVVGAARVLQQRTSISGEEFEQVWRDCRMSHSSAKVAA